MVLSKILSKAAKKALKPKPKKVVNTKARAKHVADMKARQKKVMKMLDKKENLKLAERLLKQSPKGMGRIVKKKVKGK